MSGSIIWCTFIFRLQNYLFRLIFQYYNSKFNLILTQFVIPMIPWHQDYTNLVTSQIQLTFCGRNVHFVTYHRLFRTRYYKQLKYRHLEILRYHDWYFACDTKKESSTMLLIELFAEREGFEPPVPLGTVVFKTTVIEVVLFSELNKFLGNFL